MPAHFQTKADRRDRKRRAARKMRVSGASVRKLQDIILKKSRAAGIARRSEGRRQ